MDLSTFLDNPKTASAEMSYTESHGALAPKGFAPPRLVTEFDVNNRLTFTSIKAHEYYEQPLELRAKVKLLADLIRRSSHVLAYTGAGISTAAGIDDYATKAKEASVTSEGRPEVRDWKNARPTKTHRVMAALHEARMLHHWVQQNHDSLPQKAGYPQHALNEIHGSLHDPANPIVPYEGSLRGDLFQWMQEWQERGDLCLCLGSSLSGFNADSVPATAAERFRRGDGSGLVIVNLQQTPYDGEASLRIFAKVDDVMGLLAEELAITDLVHPATHVHEPRIAEGAWVGKDQIQVPFDEQGNPTNGASTIVWDLREGKHVRLTGGPYAGDIGRVVDKSIEGHYRLRFEHSINPTFNIPRRPFSLWLGNWWLSEVSRGFGIVPGGKAPLVNVEAPQGIDIPGPAKSLTKYKAMVKAGLPEGAVRQKMNADKIPQEAQDCLFVL